MPVDVGPVLYSHQMDYAGVLVQPVHDPVGAAAGREVSGQLPPEWSSHPAGGLTQSSVAEFPHSQGDCQRQPLFKGP